MNRKATSRGAFALLTLGAFLALGPARALRADDGGAYASSDLTLHEALDEAQKGAPGYLGAQAAASEQGWGRLEALSDFLPHVSFDGMRNFVDAYQVLPVSFGGASLNFPEVYPYFQYGFDASWTLFNGWGGVNNLRASCARFRAAGLDADWARVRLRQDVRLKFYQALAARELSGLADVNVSTLREHLRIVKALLANGRATRFDLLRVEVQLDDALSGQEDARDQVSVARRTLATAMGADGDARTLRGGLPEPAPAPSDAPAIADKPDVRAALLRAEAARAAAAAAAGTWLPKVSAVGSYQWYDNGYNSQNEMDPGDTAAHGTSYDVGLELSWPLFNGGGDLARGEEAARRADEAGQAARSAELQASQDRDTWRRRLAYSTQLYRAKLADVDKARESVRLATDGLKAGTRTTTEVLDAELDSFRAQAGVVSAKLAAAEALINLELALGTGDAQ